MAAIVLGMMIYWGGVKLHGQVFQMDQPVHSVRRRRPAAGAIRAFHEAGLWNHFRDIAFDFSSTLSTHSLFGTLLEGILGYQEAPTVSEVAVYFLYLIPALIFFSCRSARS